jgi:hypothetical protein
MCPELGGKPEYLDIMGFNYYYNNQWIVDTGEFLPWVNEDNDPRWQSMSSLLSKVYKRYKRPFVLTETSHPGKHRPNWIQFITTECTKLIRKDLPLWGICWYPIIDRPDWDHMQPWHRAGIWDILPDDNGVLKRVLHQPTAIALRRAQQLIEKATTKKMILS